MEKLIEKLINKYLMQVAELQDRIARMEMIFLQHASGVATEQLSPSTMRSISGDKGSFYTSHLSGYL